MQICETGKQTFKLHYSAGSSLLERKFTESNWKWPNAAHQFSYINSEVEV